MKKIFILVIAVLFALPVIVSATTYYTSGEYRFTCDVRNEASKDIRDVRVSGYVSGNSARLDFRADGYQQAYENVYLNANQKDYRVYVRMRDPYVNYDVYDNGGNIVSGAYVNASQFMYWGDEYGMRFTVPKKGFDQLQHSDVQVKVNYFTPFGERVYLRSLGSSWEIEVVIKRRDLDRSFNKIYLYLKKDGERSTVAELHKPAGLTDKLELLRTLTVDPLRISTEDIYQQQIRLLKEDIEIQVLGSQDVEQNLRMIETSYPMFKEIHKNLEIRNFLTK